MEIKELHRRTGLDKVLGNKAFHDTKNPKYDGFKEGLASLVYNFFLIKSLLLLIKEQELILMWFLRSNVLQTYNYYTRITQTTY